VPRLAASLAQAAPGHPEPQPPRRVPLLQGVLDQGQQFLAVPVFAAVVLGGYLMLAVRSA
jgi:hypothetical protein